ncbi:transcription factor bHLH153-like isoform X2 [Syzygium oleosum]|uniref:transcription factor bHLH153-like isoform X2 n=1 Tax=Syzygium oleosum TaxID=219896 RepID=UPI0024BA551E|nr:transcription factor bHLH153-like isoform X2 [Syzygium oleosum]
MFLGEKRLREKMMEQKRSPCSVDHSTITSLISKRHKGGLSISNKERKEKLGEKIVQLQQLVSPYGKTDTASVLSEASEYIQFLHEQVKEAELYSLRSRGLCLVPISCTAGFASTNGADIWAPIKTTSPRLENQSRTSSEGSSFSQLM